MSVLNIKLFLLLRSERCFFKTTKRIINETVKWKLESESLNSLRFPFLLLKTRVWKSIDGVPLY